jgi:sigma-B regulation protein RsbU (phosphoserine phosphatase)
MPDVSYDEESVALQVGDLVAVFSDGIPEATDADEQEFGADRLAELLVAHASEPVDEIVAVVTRTVEKWIHNPEGRDDLTLVLLRRTS